MKLEDLTKDELIYLLKTCKWEFDSNIEKEITRFRMIKVEKKAREAFIKYMIANDKYVEWLGEYTCEIITDKPIRGCEQGATLKRAVEYAWSDYKKHSRQEEKLLDELNK